MPAAGLQPTLHTPPGDPTTLMSAVADIAWTYANAHKDEGVEWAFGRVLHEEHGCNRRVSFVPTTGRNQPPDEGKVAFRTLQTVAMFVVDEDHGKTELLFNRVVRAAFNSIVAVIQTQDQDGTFEWFTEREGESGLMLRTPMIHCELVFRVDIPIEESTTNIVEQIQSQCRWIADLASPPAFPALDDPDNTVQPPP